MPTKRDYDLGVLYHATPTVNAAKIQREGIKAPAWLAYFRGDAYHSVDEGAGSVTLFIVRLPSNWELEKAEQAVYISHKTVPPRYLTRFVLES